MKANDLKVMTVVIGGWVLALIAITCPHAFAAKNKDSTSLHFSDSVQMEQTGLESNAAGVVSAKFDQGKTVNQKLSLILSNMTPNASYRLMAIRRNETNLTEVAQFNTDGTGKAGLNYVQGTAKNGKDNNGALLPENLDPLSEISTLHVANGSTQSVLVANLSQPGNFKYSVSRALRNKGVDSDASGSFRLNASHRETRFRLQCAALDPSKIYLLAMDSQIVQSQLTDFNGTLNILTWPDAAPFPLDLQSIAILDAQSNALLSVSFTEEPITVPGLLLHFSFDSDGANTETDRSGHGNDATVHEAAWTSNGHNGGGMNFNGVSSYLEFPTSGFPNGAESRTIAAWVWQDDIVNRHYIVGYGGDEDCTQGSEFRMALNEFASGQFSLETSFGGWHSSATLVADTWYHLVITFDGSTPRFYVNGQEVPIGSTWLSPAVNTLLGRGTLGNRPSPSCDPGKFHDGKMDDALIFDRAITLEEVQQIYSAQSQ